MGLSEADISFLQKWRERIFPEGDDQGNIYDAVGHAVHFIGTMHDLRVPETEIVDGLDVIGSYAKAHSQAQDDLARRLEDRLRLYTELRERGIAHHLVLGVVITGDTLAERNPDTYRRQDARTAPGAVSSIPGIREASRPDEAPKTRLGADFAQHGDRRDQKSAPAQWDVIDISSRVEGRLVSMNYFLRTGLIPVFTEESIRAGRNDPNQHIKWAANDSLIRTLDHVQQRVFDRIKNDRSLQDILAKPQWTKRDRVEWERRVSSFVSAEMDKVPHLGDYVTDKSGSAVRPVALNSLSQKIEGTASELSYDCEEMSALEGALMQKADNEFLPAEAGPHDYKKSSNYFYVAGVGKQSKGASYHAYIVSSATGNIIESTSDPSPDSKYVENAYAENINAAYSFDDFLRGVPAITDNGAAYFSMAAGPFIPAQGLYDQSPSGGAPGPSSDHAAPTQYRVP